MSNRTKIEKEALESAIEKIIGENPERTLDDIIQAATDYLGFAPSRPTVLRVLAKLGVSATRLTRWEKQ